MKVPVDINDILVIVGLSSVGYGLWQIYPPAALIIIGCALFVMGMRGSRGEGKVK